MCFFPEIVSYLWQACGLAREKKETRKDDEHSDSRHRICGPGQRDVLCRIGHRRHVRGCGPGEDREDHPGGNAHLRARFGRIGQKERRGRPPALHHRSGAGAGSRIGGIYRCGYSAGRGWQCRPAVCARGGAHGGPSYEEIHPAGDQKHRSGGNGGKDQGGDPRGTRRPGRGHPLRGGLQSRISQGRGRHQGFYESRPGGGRRGKRKCPSVDGKALPAFPAQQSHHPVHGRSFGRDDQIRR